MKIGRSHWFVRLAYFGMRRPWEPDPSPWSREPVETETTKSLCALFWMAAMNVMSVVALLLGAVGLFYFLGRNWTTVVGVLAVAITSVPLVALVITVASHFSEVKAGNVEPGLVSTAIFGLKHRVCPIVRIVDDTLHQG